MAAAQRNDQAFPAADDAVLRRRLRVAALCSLAANGAFALVDAAALAPEAALFRTVVRGAFTVAWIAAIAATGARVARRHPRALALLIAALLAAELALIGVPLPPADSVGVFPSMLLLTAFLPLPLGSVVAVVLMFAGAFVAAQLGLAHAPVAAVGKHAANILFGGAVAVVTAVLMRRAREREVAARRGLAAANRRLAQLDRSKDQLFADLSHELRTPLTAALLALEAKPGEADHAAVRPLRRLDKLVDELLELGRLSEGVERDAPASADLAAVASMIVDDLESAFAASRIELRADLPLEPMIVAAPPAPLQKIAVNLLAHALGRSPAGGAVDVRIASAGGRASLDVAAPFQPTDAERAFEPFAGGGIGLALARELAQLHGGSLECAPGEGARFVLRLPLGTAQAVEPPARSPSMAARAAAEALDGKEKVATLAPAAVRPFALVVDEHGAVAQRMAGAIERSVARVAVARSAAEALEVSARELPDLLIIDTLLRGGGIDLIRRLREAHDGASMGILAVTALTEREHVLDALRAGADDYLAKPFESDMLRGRAEALLRLKRRREGQADDSSAEARIVAAAVHAQDAERKRLARELHDGAGQALAGAAMHLDLATASAASTTLHKARELVQQALNDIRAVSRDLHPPGLATHGLAAAVHGLCTSMSAEGLSIEPAIAEDLPRDLPAPLSLSIYRVAQAALANAARHSHCRNVRVRLRAADAALLLDVEDDGVGFLPERAPAGLGFVTMRERVASLGGSLEIQSDVGRGTAVRASVPLLAQPKLALAGGAS